MKRWAIVAVAAVLVAVLVFALVYGLPTAPPLVKADSDNDGLTDEREKALGTDPHDPDTDNDGLSDGDEVNKYGTSPVDFDTDGDGLGDGDEIDRGTDPKDIDSDDDGLKDGEEVMSYKTDPLDPDTDDDGLDDKSEVSIYNTDPLKADTDDDGLNDYEELRTYNTDPLDPDTDDDGLYDGAEIERHTDPRDPDTDNDGFKDGVDLFPRFNAYIIVELKYWKEWEHADPLLSPVYGDPCFNVSVYISVGGKLRIYDSKVVDVEGNLPEAWNLATVKLKFPDNIRYVYVVVWAWDDDWPGAGGVFDYPDQLYDLSDDPKYIDVCVRYDVLAGKFSVVCDGSKDGDDPDYYEAYLEFDIYVGTLADPAGQAQHSQQIPPDTPTHSFMYREIVSALFSKEILISPSPRAFTT